MKKIDIVVIGAGIAGLTSAIYLKRSNADFVILEGGETGGLLNQLKTVENYPAFPKTGGAEILKSLLVQIKQLGIDIYKEKVQTILKEENGFEVKSDTAIYKCKAVIVATGVSKQTSTIPGEDKYAGLGVSYCATCDGNFFKGQEVAVIGNNDVALEESLYLSNLVSKLYLLNPSDSLSGDKELISKLSSLGNVNIINNSKIESINGDAFGVTSVTVNSKEIKVSGVFPYIGQKSSSQILNNLKPEMNGVYVKTNNQCETNIHGLFAAGDLNDKKLRQLVTAASDGAIAAISAFQYIKGVLK